MDIHIALVAILTWMFSSASGQDDVDVLIIDEPAGEWKFDSLRPDEQPCFAYTECGRIEGRTNQGVHVFKGVPYAKPPVKELRWRPPVSLKEGKECWAGTFPATQFGPYCSQFHFNLGLIGEEDCLHLNVYTPSLDPTADLPVMVWIHGGSFTACGSAEFGYHPNETTVHDTGMVYVTFNYRINSFGFLALDILSEQSETKTSGNYGILDQILVLKWVRDNIQNFGGDPDSVTIFGQSSGGTAVMVLAVSPLARGLFHRGWMSSGSPRLDITLEQASRDNLVFLERSNCSDIECLYSLTPEEVVMASPIDVFPYWGSVYTGSLPKKDFIGGAVCVVDGHVLPFDPMTAWEKGKSNDVPLVIGTTAQEIDFLPKTPKIQYWSWQEYEDHVKETLDMFGTDIRKKAMELYPYNKSEDTPELVLTTMASDIVINCGATRVAKQAARASKSPVYRYIANWWPSVPFTYLGWPWKPRYAFHLSDIFAFWGFLPYYMPNPTEEDKAFQNLMQRVIGHFARRGVMPEDLNWPVEPDGLAMISSVLTPLEDYHVNECEFWKESGFYNYTWMS